jgi:hypothetical protein
MLKKLIKNGYGIKEDLNCAETILYGANQVYHLGLNPDSLKLSAPLAEAWLSKVFVVH